MPFKISPKTMQELIRDGKLKVTLTPLGTEEGHLESDIQATIDELATYAAGYDRAFDRGQHGYDRFFDRTDANPNK